MVTNIDDNIGRLVKQLNDKGIADNTMIIFMSDNGPAQPRYISGLRGRKTSVYEGGIKVPAFIHYSELKPTRVSTTLSHIDWLPTLLAYLNIEEETAQMDGKSFSDALVGKEVENEFQDRPLYYHWHRGYPEATDNTAIRKGDYKLVVNAWQGPDTVDYELFNLKKDPGETTNLITQESKIADSLKKEFETWLATNLRENEEFNYPTTIIGSDQQTTTVFTWNDALGSPVPWSSDENYCFWDVKAVYSGNYRIKVIFRQPMEKPGNLLIRIGPFQQTIKFPEAGTTETVIEDFYVKEGDYRLEAVYFKNWKEISVPFVIEVEKMDEK